MLIIKKGVKGYCETGCVRPQIWDAISIAEKVFSGFGYDCTITSLCDGKHSRNSKHYEGNALDLRTRHLKGDDAQKIKDVLANRLGSKYDVILEGNHIHVEFDPKS